MNFATKKDDRGINHVSYEKKKPVKVSDSELKTRISSVKNSLNSSNFDPHALRDAYNSVTDGRGYSAFSKEAMDEWNSFYGHMGPVDIKDLVDQKTEAFLKSVHDPNGYNHAQNRESYKKDFGASEQAVYNHFMKETNLLFGRTFRNGAPHFRDYSYEQRMLATAPVRNADQQTEKNLLNALMEARWNCQGYADDDQQFIDKFYNWAIALKPSGAKFVSE